MSSRIIAVVSLMAGAGRTTVATNLAGELARFNRIALIDCDTLRGRSADWGALRQQETYSERFIVQTASTPTALLERLYRLRETVDYVIVDGPRANAAMTSAIMSMAKLCLMPIDASVADRGNNPELLMLLEDARKSRKVRARIVRTRCHCAAGPGIEQDEQPETSLRPGILKSSLGPRSAYPEALDAGRTAGETKDSVARDEVQALAMEIKLMLRPARAPGTATAVDEWPDTVSGGALGPRSLMHLIG